MPDDFQLGLLPERNLDWRTIAASYGIEIAVLLLVVGVGLVFPDRLDLIHRYRVIEVVPATSLKQQPRRIAKPRLVRAKLLPPASIQAPKLIVPREVITPRMQMPEPPKVAVNTFAPTVLKQLTTGGARPVQVVHTGEFGSSVAPTINAPIEKVQTGGFGDPAGISGSGKEGAKLVAARVGSFDLPQGTGQGNGTGGGNGMRGTIASAGFGSGIASAGQGDGRSNGRGASVSTGAFGAQQVAQPVTQRQINSGPPTTTVEITYKPNPVYTEEARQLKLEGEVLLEIMFGATGQLHVNRLVRGLGHGLDEAAVAAANKMRFKPALRNGTPVDSTAVVHVVFQLAY
jgi:TonB family protein